MDSDSQPDKPPQGHSLGFNNVVGMIIAFITLITPLIAIILFSTPSSNNDPLVSFHERDDYSAFVAGLSDLRE